MQELIETLGAGKVSLSHADRAPFREDYTEVAGTMPDAVVRAESVEDVARVLAFASARRIPVIPVVSNSNVGGLALPAKGGLMLEMTRMNRVIEVNEADMYMVIEPGVTWGQVKTLLDERYPTLRFGYSLAPPDTSVLCNGLLDGLNTLSLRHGAMSEWVNGVEAVLSTGEVLRTGIGAFSAPWCSGAPMPDLTGLFINTHGTTGVVTKMSIQLWPNRKHRRRYFLPVRDPRAGIEFMRALAREELMDDIGGISWPLAKQLFGHFRPKFRDPAEPELFIHLDFSSNWEDDLEHKDRLLRRVMAGLGVAEDPLNIEDLVSLVPEFGAFSELPARLTFMVDHPGGGLTWIGTYGPTSRWTEGYEAAREVMTRAGFPPAVVMRPMRTAHFGVLRMITTYDKKDPAEVDAVHRMNEALCDAIVPLGFVPYKTPPWVLERFRDRLDEGFIRTLGRVKELLDPHGILNPGKWLL